MTPAAPDPAADSSPPPTAAPTAPLVQSTSGGIRLGAYNHIEQIGDLVAGDKIINLVIYTGPAQPRDDEARRSLEQAYRSEVAARYAAWRTRYASLTIQTTSRPPPENALPRYEREELVFAALRLMVADDVPQTEPERAPDRTGSHAGRSSARTGDLHRPARRPQAL